MICPNCQSEIADTSKFCRKCGVPVAAPAIKVETKFCPACGAENAASAKFCKADGFRFTIPGESAPPPAAVAEPAPAARSVPPPQPPESPPITATPARAPAAMQPSPTPTAPAAPAAAPAFTPVPKPAQPSSVSAPRTAPGDALRPTPARTTPLAPIPVTRPATSKSSVGLVVGVAALLLAIGGGGGYWYFLGGGQKPVQAATTTPAAPMAPPVQAPAPRAPAVSEAPPAAVPTPPAPDPAKVTPVVKQALMASGFPTLGVRMGPDLVATLEGTVANEQDKAAALAVAQSVRGVKAVSDQMQVATATVPPPVAPPPASAKTAPLEAGVPPANPGSDARAMARDLTAKLRAAGLAGVSVKVGPDLAINLTGTVASAQEKNEAIRLALSIPGSNRIEENLRITAPALPPTLPAASANATPPPSVDPAKLEGEVNRALRNGGVGGVTSQVADDLSLTLKGSGSAAQKETAMRIAREFKGVKRVRDQVFVVEQ